MNITHKGIINPCTSCQMCAAVCPTQAISICINKDGFYRPAVDADKCIDCSLCTKVCYKYNEPLMTPANKLNNYSCYALSVKDQTLLQNVTSGGFCTVLAKHCIELGYKCVGVVYDTEKDIAEHLVAENEEDVELFKGSKYIQSYSFGAFRKVITNFLNEKVVIFGAPCHIYAIDLYLRRKKKRDNFLLVDFYCHGCPSIYLWQSYVRKIHKNTKIDRFDAVNFRSKINGWGNFVISATKNHNIEYISNNYSDSFYELFFSDCLLNDSCNSCKLRSTLEYSDIRVGDFWGKCYDTNTTGVSAVTIVSEKGKTFFNEIKAHFEYKRHDFGDFLPYQSWGKSYKVNYDVRNRILACLKRDDINQAIVYYHSKQPLFLKLKRVIKKLLSLLPNSCVQYIKKLYHTIK